ncbi:MAG TPA: hypothetical protein VGQ19_13160, partial [Burkholderiales bacterium]|nr:hypothetical protein [Burkholderiales bacterium]
SGETGGESQGRGLKALPGRCFFPKLAPFCRDAFIRCVPVSDPDGFQNWFAEVENTRQAKLERVGR